MQDLATGTTVLVNTPAGVALGHVSGYTSGCTGQRCPVVRLATDDRRCVPYPRDVRDAGAYR